MTDANTLTPTDADIIALADKTRTGEPGRDGYILPISFARAVLAKWGAPADALPPELTSIAKQASIAAVEVAAPIAPAREPLADEQIEKLCAGIGFTSWPEWDGGTFQEMWMQLARAIEAAHGITAAQKGGKHGTE